MVADLSMPDEILGVPTVRDSDGLALSSRNAYLSVDERQRALALPNALRTAAERIAGGSSIAQAISEAKRCLSEAGFHPVDYVALVDAETLEPIDEPRGAMRLIAAATIGSTRLIDNVPIATDEIPPR